MRIMSFMGSAGVLAAAFAFTSAAVPNTAQAQAANCPDAIIYAMATAGAPLKGMRPHQTRIGICKAAKGRPALATRNFAHGFVVARKVGPGKNPPKPAMQACMQRMSTVSRALQISPKFATPQNLGGACKSAGARPVLAMRNYLDRFVVQAKIAPSILRPSCMQVMSGVTKTLQMSPKFATGKNLATACKNAKGRPAVATRNFTAAFVKKFKIENGKKAPANMAKTCEPKLTRVSKMLRINPKFANAKDIKTACGKALWKPAVATRNFTARFIKTATRK